MFSSLKFRIAARRFIHEIFEVNFEACLDKIDELGGLNFQTRAEHFSKSKQNQGNARCVSPHLCGGR